MAARRKKASLPHDRMGELIKDVERLAGQLRKQVVAAAAHVEKYILGLRRELAGGASSKVKTKKPARKRARRATKPRVPSSATF